MGSLSRPVWKGTDTYPFVAPRCARCRQAWVQAVEG